MYCTSSFHRDAIVTPFRDTVQLNRNWERFTELYNPHQASTWSDEDHHERKKINCHAPTFDTNSTTSWTIIIYYYYYYYIIYIIVQYNFTFCVQYTVLYNTQSTTKSHHALLCMYIKHIYEISTISALTTAHSDHQQYIQEHLENCQYSRYGITYFITRNQRNNNLFKLNSTL